MISPGEQEEKKQSSKSDAIKRLNELKSQVASELSKEDKAYVFYLASLISSEYLKQLTIEGHLRHENGGPELLGFKTKGSWSANDLNNFIFNIIKLYDTIFTYHYDVFGLVYSSNKEHMKKNDIIRRIENHLEESKKLSVYRIMIGSPGGFSLTGIPETIREVKELIRYIWKLRRQDDLDNKKKCLDLVKEWFEITHNDKPKIIDIKIAIELLCDGIINIKKFEASGKIDDVLNNLEYLPEYTDFDSNTQNLRQNINRE